MVKKQTEEEKAALSTESYKGVRDFFPEDMRIQKYIFNIMRKTAESYGYEEYGASILEPSELYEAKSGEEIVNEQTYTFTDRGGRKVTLRPEMTPTVARMIAGKSKAMTFPARWYSIPNLFRYEQPQKGRLREHFQLNVDIFGIENTAAEVEVIALANNLMKNFGATPSNYVIRINSRKIISALYEKYSITGEDAYKLSKVIDKKNKISGDAFDKGLEMILHDKASEFKAVLASNKEVLNAVGEDTKPVLELLQVIEALQQLGISNVIFDQTLMRGFDYYTGIVFEIFDTNPNNMRSLFGGGRYDELTSLFGGKQVHAFGFGAGDVTMKDFLDTHNLLPKGEKNADVYIAQPGETTLIDAMRTADLLRGVGLEVVVDLGGKKIGDQIKRAEKLGVPFVLFVGEEEIKSKTYKVKDIRSGTEESVSEEKLSAYLLEKSNS